MKNNERKIFVVLAMIVAISLVSGCSKEPQNKTNSSAQKSAELFHQLQGKISVKAEEVFDDIVNIRRDIHKNPELSGQEVRTSRIIADRLESLGLEVKRNMGGHGVLGVLRGNRDKPVVAYRADMDALPQEIQEDVEFKSVVSGVCHGCGHDVHVAVGLGIAEVMASVKDEIPGTLMFIFQPSEENVQGALQMIEAGVLQNPKPDVIYAIHVMAGETGTMITNPGVGLPGVVTYSVTLTGSEGLEAAAQSCLDVVSEINTIQIPQNFDEYMQIGAEILKKDGALADFVYTGASIDEKTSTDKKTVVNGFMKASGEVAYSRAQEKIRNTLSNMDSEKISHELSFTVRLPDMICDKDIALRAIPPLKAVLGDENVQIAYASIPFHGEDFAYFLEKIPGVMFYLGASNFEEGIISAPHNPTFAVDEKAILYGIKAVSGVIIDYLLTDFPEE